MGFVFLWIIVCDLLVMVYGVQFDLQDLFSLTPDVEEAYQAAELQCPSDPESALGYFWTIQYNEQITRINAASGDAHSLADFVDAEGSMRWLLLVVESTILSWFVWTPLFSVLAVIYGLYSWEVNLSPITYNFS